LDLPPHSIEDPLVKDNASCSMLVNVDDSLANLPTVLITEEKDDSAETYVVSQPSPQEQAACYSSQKVDMVTAAQENMVFDSHPESARMTTPTTSTVLSDSKETYTVCPSPERFDQLFSEAKKKDIQRPIPPSHSPKTRIEPTKVVRSTPVSERNVSSTTDNKENVANMKKPVTLTVSPPAKPLPPSTNRRVLNQTEPLDLPLSTGKRPLKETKPMNRTRTLEDTMVVSEKTRESSIDNTGPVTRRRSALPATKKSRKPAARASMHRLTLIRQPRVTASTAGVVRNPNPFASKNIYYDERWVEKQESGFSKWLNFVLTPECLDEDGEVANPSKLDVAKLWRACSSEARVPRAPTREVLSMRAYSARKQLNRLRRHACILWQTPAVAKVIARMEIEVEKKRLIVRQDKSLNRDVGMKRSFLELVLTYNPLWLRIGLETIFGELLPLSGAGDVVGLSRFVLGRMLTNPSIEAEFAHPTVPHHYRNGFQDALKAFTLKKFLQLVFFLDRAKENKLIIHDPCLFCKGNEIKVGSLI